MPPPALPVMELTPPGQHQLAGVSLGTATGQEGRQGGGLCNWS
jgi:hypothetical protein